MCLRIGKNSGISLKGRRCRLIPDKSLKRVCSKSSAWSLSKTLMKSPRSTLFRIWLTLQRVESELKWTSAILFWYRKASLLTRLNSGYPKTSSWLHNQMKILAKEVERCPSWLNLRIIFWLSKTCRDKSWAKGTKWYFKTQQIALRKSWNMVSSWPSL